VTANTIRYLRRRKTNAWMNAVVAMIPSSPISSYIRVSPAYWVRNGLNANSVAAYRPARRPIRLLPAQNPAGIVSSPNSSDSQWVAVSLAPNAWIQKCSRK